MSCQSVLPFHLRPDRETPEMRQPYCRSLDPPSLAPEPETGPEADPESGASPSAAAKLRTVMANDTVVKTALMGLCLIVGLAALDIGQVVFAPVCLAVVIGMLFGPAEDWLAGRGVHPGVSALVIVFFFVAVILMAGAAFSVPLSGWMDKLPQIWKQLQAQVTSWDGLFHTLSNLQNGLRSALGQDGSQTVSVTDGSAVERVVTFAPSFVAQVILFLASLYFFIRTRIDLRQMLVRLSPHAQTRHKIGGICQTIERRLSRYLVSITAINLVEGICVALALWALDVPSPLMWGMLAGLLNYVIYVGPAVMVALLLGVGLAVGATTVDILAPAGAYLVINLIEAQFVTPTVLGKTMTLNPFIVFFCTAFWIWLWGPVGGFVAVPILLAVTACLDDASSSLPRRSS